MSDWSVEYSDDGGSTYTTIDWADFTIEWGLSDIQLAPLASVDAGRQVGASTGDILRIQKSGVTKFDGTLTTGGEIGRQGQNRLRAEHDIYRVFADSVSINETNPTDQDVLSAALSAADGGGNYTLTYNPTPVSLGDDYEVDDRKVKRVFRDMTDRTDRVFYVGIGDTIEVVERGAGSEFAALSAGDGFRVESYNPGDIDTVRNAVTVNGTGSEQVQSTETDSTSINEYGRRSEVYNFEYITSTGEASSMASELLIPDPLPDAELLLGTGVGAVADIQLNRSIDFNDSQGTGASDNLTIEKQTVTAGSTTVDLGKGAGVSIANVNRDGKSVDDNSTPGSVYNTDRIADDAVESAKLVDTSVTEQKLADLAVATDKLQSNAVINGKLEDLSVSETKVQDDAISTPKLVAEAVTASEIESDTITASEIAGRTITALEIQSDEITANEIAGRTITAQEIASDEITANEIDVLNLDASTISIGDFEFEVINNRTVLQPEFDQVGEIGTPSKRLNNINSSAAAIDTLQADFATLLDGEFGDEDAGDEQIEIISFGGGVSDGTALYPTQDETCALGGLLNGNSKAFNSMRSHNFNTATPERLDGVDASDVTDYSFHEPPLCAAQNKDSSTESGYRRRNPSKAIEIGHITNYLFEVCKDQQETIESQADRIESLESTVEDLESRLTALEAKQE